MSDRGEFYIGWEDKAPPEVGRSVRRVVVALLALIVAAGATLALAQQTVGVGVFEWGRVKSFTGTLQSEPYPHLLVSRPGMSGEQTPFSSYYLVNPFKFGIDPETAARFHGQTVSLKGTLIYRGGQTMIEVAEGSIRPAEGLLPAAFLDKASVSLGRQTLIGEIVDSKCFLGVMNPGALIPHRACAIRCISGGVPPILVVRQTNGLVHHFLLVSRDGKPVNKQVLDLVAESVEITGEVERQGELLILRADPATYRRLRH